MLGEAIYSLLKTTYPKTFPVRAAQETPTPYLVYKFISNVPEDIKDGASELDTYRLQLTCYADTYRECHTILEDIRTNILDRYRGVVAGVNIDKIIFSNEIDLFENESEFHQLDHDYIIRVKR